MRRLTKAEKAAAAAVLAAAAGVAATGISLLKKHTKFMAQKAAATFQEDEEMTENTDWEEDEDKEVESEAAAEENGEEAKERQYIKL